jgi:hypothetical protein
MFRFLQVKKQPVVIVSDAGSLTVQQLSRDPSVPITLRQIGELDENLQRRIYRGLLPPDLLAQFKIDPITWKGPQGEGYVQLQGDSSAGKVLVSARNSLDGAGDFFSLEIADNAFNGIDLNLLELNDPNGETFGIDYDEQGQPTLFGTLRRNLAEEQRALRAGLAPGQRRPGLGASRIVLGHMETFLAALGHRAYFLEPLTYASAWVFERRGFAYVRGHKLMDDIHREFQPGGRLHAALDSGTPFRQIDHWKTVRGRAWAIHDGLLEVMDTRWDKLRMVKQIGQHAGVETFPGAVY